MGPVTGVRLLVIGPGHEAGAEFVGHPFPRSPDTVRNDPATDSKRIGCHPVRVSKDLIRLGRPSAPPAPERGGERFVGIALAIILAAPFIFLVIAYSSHRSTPVATAMPSSFTAGGEVDLIDGDRLPQGDPCLAPTGYTDIRQGAPVIIRDRGGTQVATGALDAGRTDGTGRCVFTWEAANVPTVGGPYVADIAGHGTVPVTAPTG